MTDKLATLQHLQSLTIDNCGLNHMPNLHGLFNLKRISLSNNHLSKLEGLVRVRSISLNKNRFTSIPTLEQPEALIRLEMNDNPVQHMTNLNYFINLTDIQLAHADISLIPSEINQLNRLCLLDLSYNKINHIPKTLLNLARLQFFNIRNNPISNEEIRSIQIDFNMEKPTTVLLI